LTASTLQPKARRERRIIDRPRLIKLLDECEARIILLLAPAGYGKTTLARQWAKTLTRSIWITCTPAHRDITAFAEDVMRTIDTAETDQASRFLREYVRAQSNPQRSGRRIAEFLGKQIRAAGVQWMIVDDYHEILDSPEVEALVEVLQAESGCHLMLASRRRPTWATSRRIVYGELAEFTRDVLAMTDQECEELLGRRKGLADIATRAQGWPAVLALAAASKELEPPKSVLPSALHSYLAEEIYQAAPSELRERLLALALLPASTPDVVAHVFGGNAGALVAHARQLGFVAGEGNPDLHPLLRDFLLEKLQARPEARAQVHEAIEYCLDGEHWSAALGLVSRFSCDDLIEPVLQRSFKPLARNGHIETLSSFASEIRLRPTFPPPSVDVVDAEVALRDGHLDLAADLASRARATLSVEHPLRSRASAVLGHSNLLTASLPEAESAFADARATAADQRDETDAMHGLALAKIVGEQSDARQTVKELLQRRHESPTLLVRATTAEVARRRFNEGLAKALPVDEALHALDRVEDPRVRTSFTYLVAYTLAQKAEYQRANDWVLMLMADVEEFDLEFARPHAAWTAALVRLGARKFGETERLLQSLEDAIAAGHMTAHRVNARALRARLLLQTGQADRAVEMTNEPVLERVYPSWLAEYLATRALALACLGEESRALAAAAEANRLSRVVEVRMLAATARAILSARAGDVESASNLLADAMSLGTWDPVVCGLRSSRPLAEALAAHEPSRNQLESLYAASNDLGLARRAGFRTRSTRSPDQVLSPREREVMGLIAKGLRNREIAEVLYISQSTAKVHVRHVLEKLGVRTRAEAVARYEMFKDAT
jgi:LuxR family maltose regulon positive regulatory protein